MQKKWILSVKYVEEEKYPMEQKRALRNIIKGNFQKDNSNKISFVIWSFNFLPKNILSVKKICFYDFARYNVYTNNFYWYLIFNLFYEWR
jgi:hypothetical protein